MPRIKSQRRATCRAACVLGARAAGLVPGVWFRSAVPRSASGPRALWLPQLRGRRARGPALLSRRASRFPLRPASLPAAFRLRAAVSSGKPTHPLSVGCGIAGRR